MGTLFFPVVPPILLASASPETSTPSLTHRQWKTSGLDPTNTKRWSIRFYFSKKIINSKFPQKKKNPSSNEWKISQMQNREMPVEAPSYHVSLPMVALSGQQHSLGTTDRRHYSKMLVTRWMSKEFFLNIESNLVLYFNNKILIPYTPQIFLLWT